MPQIVESSRQNPDQMAYFQSAADVVALAGLFHQQMVSDGYKPFAYRLDTQSILQGKKDNSSPLEIGDYAEKASTCIKHAWIELWAELHRENPGDKLSPNYAVFTDPYVKDLIYRTVRLGKGGGSLMGIHKEVDDMNRLLFAGFENGAHIVAQLCAIFGDDFDPNYPVLASRVHLKNNITVRSLLGILAGDDRKSEIPVSYGLLHPTEGLNRQILRDLGRGFAISCPASLPISEELDAYLRSNGISVGRETMLKRYSRDLEADFKKQVRVPFEAMTAEERRVCFSERTIRLLRGDIWRDVVHVDASLPGGFDTER